MKTHKGFAALTALLIVLGVIAVGGAGYVALNPQVLKAPAGEMADDGVQTAPGDHPEEDRDANGNVVGGKSSIAWRFSDAGEKDGMPQTAVTVVVNNIAYPMGTYLGSCSEIGASGGVDGKGLLAGELSGAQCWFAGGGNEIGVFAHEDGGFEVMVGDLSEGEEGTGLFRGDFEIKNSISL